MVNGKENIILDVQLNASKVAEDLARATKQVSLLKQEQKLLNEALKEGRISDEEYGKAMSENSAELEKAQRETKGYTAVLKQLTETTGQYGDSLSEQQRKLNDMQKAYDNLSQAQRESSGGKEFLKQIQEQDKAVKEMETSTGRAGRLVGSYGEALQKAGVGLGGFTQKLKAMLANPVVAIIGAAVAIFNKLKDAFSRNDDASTKLNKAFAAFKPIVTAINQLFDKLAGVVVNVATAVSKVATSIISKLVPSYKEASDAAQELVDKQDQLEEMERNYTVNSAKRQRDIAKLRDEAALAEDGMIEVEEKRLKVTEDAEKKIASYRRVYGLIMKDQLASDEALIKKIRELDGDMSKLSDEEIKHAKLWGYAQEEAQTVTRSTMELTQQAIDLEQYDLEERLRIAKEKVRIQEALMAIGALNNDEEKNKLAELRAAEYQAEEAYYGHIRKLEKEQKAEQKRNESEQNQKNKEAERERERRLKEQEEQAKRAAAARLEIQRTTEDKLLAMEDDATKREIEQTKVAGRREIENLRKKLDELKKNDLEARKELQALIEVSERETQKRIDEIRIKAEQERESTILATRREAEKRGIKDSLELAQLQVDATQEDYTKLQALTKQQVLTLYGSWEKYYQALTSAETAAYDAQEALAIEQYNREQKRRENEYNARLIGIDNEYVLAEMELAQKQSEYDALLAMDEETKARLYANEEEYKAAVIEAESSIANETTKAVKTRLQSVSELGNMMTNMANALQNFAGESEAAAKAQRAFAFTGILLNQAQSISEGALAIAKGVESASAIPFPANIPAIISITAQIGSMIAGAMSSIAQAKQIFAQSDAGNFSHGGTIEGNSYTGDKLIAHVNSGEGIYTGKQANNLLQDIANNPLHGGNLDAMTAAFTAAVAALPAPKMVYSEFDDFTQEVATYDELAEI